MAYVHLGIDYGTNGTKVVINDFESPGRARCYPLMNEKECRFSSGVSFEGNEVILAPKLPSYWNIKMRIARRYGPDVAEVGDRVGPKGWADEELAIATIAYIQSLARNRFISRQVEPNLRQFVPRWGMTLGIPTAFRSDEGLTKIFLDIARAAFYTNREFSVIPERLRTGDTIHAFIRAEFERQRKSPLPDNESIGVWLRTESQASVWWLWDQSDQADDGRPRFLVDIGAGTTNVIAFLVRPRADNQRGISVLGAASSGTGTNAFSANAKAIFAELESKELREQLIKPYRGVFDRVRQMTGGGGPAWEQWLRRAQVLGTGGGTVRGRGELVRPFVMNPFQPTQPPERCTLQGRPSKLELVKGLEERHHVNLSVAYGLAELSLGLPTEWLPHQIEPLDAWTPERQVDLDRLGAIYSP